MTLSWLPLAVIAYLLFAITGVIDKIIVGRAIKNPAVVSFWTAIFGTASAVIILVGLLPFSWAEPFRFSLPPLPVLAVVLAAGFAQQLSLLCAYTALQRDEATRVVSTMGAMGPIFTLVASYFILGQALQPGAALAFGLLLAGAVLISYHRGRAISNALWLAVSAAAFASLQIVLAKYAYSQHAFIPTFILLSLSGGVYALVLSQLSASVRREIMNSLPFHRPAKAKAAGAKPKRNPIIYILINTMAGGVGVLALNFALKLGPAPLINAMEGVQYAGIFLIALLLARKLPQLLDEELTAQTMVQKLSSIALIAGGIAVLTVVSR